MEIVVKREPTGFLRDLAPAPVAMGGDVSDELLIFLRRPEPPLHLLLVAAGVMPHAHTPQWEIH